MEGPPLEIDDLQDFDANLLLSPDMKKATTPSSPAKKDDDEVALVAHYSDAATQATISRDEPASKETERDALSARRVMSRVDEVLQRSAELKHKYSADIPDIQASRLLQESASMNDSNMSVMSNRKISGRKQSVLDTSMDSISIDTTLSQTPAAAAAAAAAARANPDITDLQASGLLRAANDDSKMGVAAGQLEVSDLQASRLMMQAREEDSVNMSAAAGNNQVRDLQASGLLQAKDGSVNMSAAAGSNQVRDLQASGLLQAKDGSVNMSAAQNQVSGLQASGLLQARDDSANMQSMLEKSSENYTPTKGGDGSKSLLLDKSSFNFTPFKTPHRQNDTRLSEISEEYDSVFFEAQLEEAEVWEYDTSADKWVKDTCLIRIAPEPMSVSERKTCFKMMDVTNRRCVHACMYEAMSVTIATCDLYTCMYACVCV
jgi:hypothetical protein